MGAAKKKYGGGIYSRHYPRSDVVSAYDNSPIMYSDFPFRQWVHRFGGYLHNPYGPAVHYQDSGEKKYYINGLKVGVQVIKKNIIMRRFKKMQENEEGSSN
jgi:hypothetical protein